jgi:hypothetical protein
MNPLRPVVTHFAALVLAGLSAGFVFSREKTPLTFVESTAVIWNGRPSELSRIVYETPSRRLTLEAKEDSGQRWFLGSSQSLPAPAPAKSFPAVTTVNKLTESLASLRATRAFGKVEGPRAAELGLDKRDTSLTVVVGGREHKLWIGASSPGATDKYVLDTSNDQVYSVKIEPFQDLEAGDSRLMEHDQHDFKELDVASAKIISRDKARTVVSSGPEGKKFWADPADREKADETVVNFMQKIDRLRANEYVAKQPDNAQLVARIEYTGSAKRKGFFELMKSPSSEGADKFDYWMTTEHLRLYGKLVQASGEPIEQDIGSVVR